MHTNIFFVLCRYLSSFSLLLLLLHLLQTFSTVFPLVWLCFLTNPSLSKHTQTQTQYTNIKTQISLPITTSSKSFLSLYIFPNSSPSIYIPPNLPSLPSLCSSISTPIYCLFYLLLVLLFPFLSLFLPFIPSHPRILSFLIS